MGSIVDWLGKIGNCQGWAEVLQTAAYRSKGVSPTSVIPGSTLGRPSSVITVGNSQHVDGRCWCFSC